MNTTSLLLIGLWLSCSILKCYSTPFDWSHELFFSDESFESDEPTIVRSSNENASNKICPIKFTLLGEKCYYIQIADKKSWFDADISCNEEESSLAELRSNVEMSALEKHILSLDTKISFWISRNDDLGKRVRNSRKQMIFSEREFGYCEQLMQTNGEYLMDFDQCSERKAFVCETDPQENETDDSWRKEEKDIISQRDTIDTDSEETQSTTDVSIEETKSINDNDCPKDFIKLDDKCYYVEHENRLNWYAADRQCKKMHSYITTIENAKEMTYLNDYLSDRLYDKNKGDSWGSNGFWTGGNNLGSEGEFNWVNTGEKISYTHWYPNEPNNVNGNEHCIEISYMDYEYYMNDNVCLREYFFICETEPRQEAPSTTLKIVGVCEQLNLMRLNLEAESNLINLLSSQQQCPKKKA